MSALYERIVKFSPLLPFLGAGGFIALSEVSISRPHDFLWWSLVTSAWILTVFFALVHGKLKSRLTPVAVPAVLMIAVSTIASLLFLDLVANRHLFIAVFGFALYLFLEHVRREDAAPVGEERLSISEFARMVNIGSLFLVASVAVGVPAFLPVQTWWTIPPMIIIALLWSWHLFLACTEHCVRPRSRIFLTALVVVETYLVALNLPTSMFVGGAVVAIVYYLAANLLPIGATDTIPGRLVRKYAIYAGIALALVLLTARWV
jgi:hypothetical protein